MRSYIIRITFALLLSLTSTAQEDVSGYFFQYQSTSTIEYNYLTDLVYCSINGNTNGNLVTNGYSSNPTSGFDLNKFQTIKSDAGNAGVNLWLKVGGIDYNNTIHSIYQTIASDLNKLNTFTNELVSFAVTENIYGLIFHLENDGSTTSLDQQLELLDSISSQIKRSSNPNLKLGLHVKGYSSVETATDKIHPNLFTSKYNIIDYWFLEPSQIDFSKYHFSPINDAITNVEQWQNAGVSLDKMYLGISFEASTLDQQSLINYKDLGGNPAIISVENYFNGYYYNGIPTVQKKQDYSFNKGMKGVFIWNVEADRGIGDYSLLESLNSSRRDFCPYFPVLGETQYLNDVVSVVLNTQLDGANKTFSWKKGGNSIAGTDSAITVYSIGSYEVTVTYPTGCSFNETVFVDIDLGSNEIKNENFSFINNSTQEIVIRSKSPDEFLIQIYSMSGKLVFQTKSKDDLKISTNGYSKGVYTILKKCKKEILSQKLIIR